MEAGRLWVTMGLDRSNFTSGMTQTRNDAQGLGGFLKGAFQFSVGQGMFDLMRKGLEGVKEAAKQALDWNSMMQNAQIGFTTMLGSAQKADAFLREMADFAQNTPFELKGLLESSRMMKAMGFEANEIKPSLTAIGDAISAMGGKAENVKLVTIALGQMNTSGRVNAQDMMQLTTQGIDGWGYLAKAIGKSTAEVRKMSEQGLIPGREAARVILAGMEQDFKGQMKKMENTWQGAWSAIKDTLSQILGEATKKVFESLNDMVVSAKDFIGEFQQVFRDKGLAEALKMLIPQSVLDAVQNLASWVQIKLVPQLSELYKNLVTIGKTAIPIMQSGLTVLSTVTRLLIETGLNVLNSTLKFFADNARITTAVVTGLVAGFVAFRTALLIQAVITGVSAAMGVLTTLMVAYRTGTLLATAQQWLLNAALTANPIGLVVTALAALVAGIAAYIGITQQSTSTTEQDNEAIRQHEEIIKKAEAAKISMAETNTDLLQTTWIEIGSTEKLTAEYEKLKGKANLTTEEKKRLEIIQKRLLELYPQVAGAIDGENKISNAGIGIIQNLTAENKKYLLQELATKKILGEARSADLAAEKAALETSQKLQMDALERFDAIMKDRKSKGEDVSGVQKNIDMGSGFSANNLKRIAEIDAEEKSLKKVNDTIASLNEQAKKNVHVTKEVISTTKKSGDTFEDTSKKLNAVIGANSKLKDSESEKNKQMRIVADNIKDKYQNAVTNLKESISRLTISNRDNFAKDIQNTKQAVSKQDELITTLKKRYDDYTKSLGANSTEAQNAKKDYEAAVTDKMKLTEKLAELEVQRKEKIQKIQDDARKKAIDGVNRLNDALISALQKRYEKEKSLEEKRLTESLKSTEKNYQDQRKLREKYFSDQEVILDAETKAKTDAIQDQIDDIDAKQEAEDKALREKEYNQKLSDLRTKLEAEQDANAKLSIQDDLNTTISDWEKQMQKEKIDAQKAALRLQIEDLKAANAAKKDELQKQKDAEFAIADATLEKYRQDNAAELDILNQKYDAKLAAVSLKQEAEKLIIDKNQSEIVSLLGTYGDKYEIAGTTLGEKLIGGIKKGWDGLAQASINDMLNSVTGSFGGKTSSGSTYSGGGTSPGEYNTNEGGYYNANKGTINKLANEKGVDVGVATSMFRDQNSSGGFTFTGVNPVTGSISSIFPQLATGTNYVPQDMLAMIHKGEAVVPAKYNKGSGDIVININGNVSGDAEARKIGRSIVREMKLQGVG